MEQAKLLEKKNSKYYYEINCPSYYIESDYQKKIMQHFRSLFPDYWAVCVHYSFETPEIEEKCVPDFILIRKDYLEWIIVEVELQSDVKKNVVKQLKVFSRPANITPNLISKIESKILDDYPECGISKSGLNHLVTNSNPKVLLIIDELPSSWVEDIFKKILIMFFQIYINTDGDFIYRVKGEVPIMESDNCVCLIDKRFPTMLNLSEDGFLPDQDEIGIWVNGKLTNWTKVNPRKIRSFAENFPIEYDYNYRLVKDQRNSLFLERI